MIKIVSYPKEVYVHVEYPRIDIVFFEGENCVELRISKNFLDKMYKKIDSSLRKWEEKRRRKR